MTKIGTKEAPLIAAMSRTGPLPGFLFASPVGSGITCGAMIPIFGAVFGMFFVMSVGVGDTLDVYNASAGGALLIGAGSAALLLVILCGSFFCEDGPARRSFCLAALATLMVWAGLWGLAHPHLQHALVGVGSIA